MENIIPYFPSLCAGRLRNLYVKDRIFREPPWRFVCAKGSRKSISIQAMYPQQDLQSALRHSEQPSLYSYSQDYNT